MKKGHFFGKICCVTLLATFLGSAATVAHAASEPVIAVFDIPQLSRGGTVEGRVIWDGLKPENFGQYAVIAMLHAPWGDDYVKPSYVDYLNAIDPQGFFSINISTDANDAAIDVVYLYFVERSKFFGSDGVMTGGDEVKSNTILGKFTGQPLTVSRTAWWSNRIQSIEKGKDTQTWIVRALALGVCALVFFMLYYRQTRRFMQKEKMMKATDDAIETEFESRRAIAQDLHDRLGAMLSLVMLNLNNIESARRLLKEAIAEMRRISYGLMPDSLFDYGLRTALDDFCTRLMPLVHLYSSGDDLRYSKKVEVSTYLATIELINNAIKHSGAGKIDILIVEARDSISITVQDNGCGFDFDDKARDKARDTDRDTDKDKGKCMGLASVRKRLAYIGGVMDIHSKPGAGNGTGTKILLKITGIVAKAPPVAEELPALAEEQAVAELSAVAAKEPAVAEEEPAPSAPESGAGAQSPENVPTSTSR
jgi:signal transduction histidine kinase